MTTKTQLTTSFEPSRVFSMLYLISTILIQTRTEPATTYIRGLAILKLSESFILPTCVVGDFVPVQVGCVWMHVCACELPVISFFISIIVWGDLTHYQLFLCLLYRDMWNNLENIFPNNMHIISYILRICFRNSFNVYFAGRLDTLYRLWKNTKTYQYILF